MPDQLPMDCRPGCTPRHARAQAQAIHKTIAATSGIEDVAAIKAEATETAQTFAKVGIYADQRIGEILRELPKGSRWKSDSHMGESETKADALQDAGISRSEAYRLEELASNPEVVQAVLDKAEAEGRIPSRKQVLDAIKERAIEDSGMSSRLAYDLHWILVMHCTRLRRLRRRPTMLARELFESLEAQRNEVSRLQDRVALAHRMAGGLPSIGSSRSGLADHYRGIDRLIDSGTVEHLERARGELSRLKRAAKLILYGTDGTRGLARARGRLDADILWCRYVDGMSWSEMAKELAPPDSKDAAQWCKRRAYRAMEHIDRVGAKALL